MAFLGNVNGAATGQVTRTRQRTIGLLNFVVALAIAAVAYTDWTVEANVSLGYLYVLPLALSGMVNPWPLTIALAFACTVLQDIFGPPADTMTLRAIRNLIDIGAFLAAGFLVTLIARQRTRLEQEIERQRDEYERDLVLASQVQRQVLPKPIAVPGLEIGAVMRPARLLGGDYYDFFPISDGIMDVVIADVSGKGAAAALLMPSLAVALRLRAKELNGPAAILKELDGVLKQVTRPSTFVTIFYARINHARRTLEYSCGGHNPPLLVRPGTGESCMLSEAGPIVGILSNAEYFDTSIALQRGDVLALYTDGVSEQENAAEEQFSADRLKMIVSKYENATAEAIVNGVADAVAEWAGSTEQEDDLTVVVAKIE